MTQKEITLNGKTYPVVFTMKTIIGFEDIIGHSFFDEKTFSTFKVRIALIIAAYAATLDEDKDAEISFTDFANIESVEGMNEVMQAFNTVMDLSKNFFHIPDVEKGKEKKKKGEKEKNA